MKTCRSTSIGSIANYRRTDGYLEHVGWVLVLGFIAFRVWPQAAAALGVGAESGPAAPTFAVGTLDGGTVSLDDFTDAPALLVMFICNHCPFVKHVREELSRIGREYTGRGVAVVAISSNDPEIQPADSPERERSHSAAGASLSAAVQPTQ